MSRIKRCQNRRLLGKGDRVLGLLPELAHRSLDALSELRATFDGLYELAGNPIKRVTADDLVQTRQIHEVVLSCTRARANY
jgi:hypothetical protein